MATAGHERSCGALGADGCFGAMIRHPGIRGLTRCLNVFSGHDAAHRVTPIEGDRLRLIAILSCMDQRGLMFTPEDRVQVYRRAG